MFSLLLLLGLLSSVPLWAWTDVRPMPGRRIRLQSTASMTSTKPVAVQAASSPPSEAEEVKKPTIEEEIEKIIASVAATFRTSGSLQGMNPSLLTENSHILCKGRVYEDVMRKKLSDVTSGTETTLWQRVDAFLQGFISTERKARARLKVNYMLAGASSNRLDLAISNLADSDELDDDLVLYIQKLIRTQEQRLGGLESILNGDGELEYDPRKTADSPSIDVLRLVLKRVQAEMRTQGNLNLRLLSRLMPLAPRQRLEVMRDVFTRVEMVDDFANFVHGAIRFLVEDVVDGQVVVRDYHETVEVAPGTLETLRDVLRDVQTFQRQLRGNEPGATIFEYKQKDD